MITTSNIDKKRGKRTLSNAFIKGNNTNANKAAIVKGKITEEAIFSTVAAMIIQIKTNRKKTGLPNEVGFGEAFIAQVWHKRLFLTRKYLTLGQKITMFKID